MDIMYYKEPDKTAVNMAFKKGDSVLMFSLNLIRKLW